MKPYRLFTLPLLAVAAMFGAAAHATDHTPTPTPLEKALINAFECRSIEPNIDAALKARHIRTDGSTHTTLRPPITIVGHPVSDVTVFRQGSEDIYTSYLILPAEQRKMATAISAFENSLQRGIQQVAPNQSISKPIKTLSVTRGPNGQVVLQCTIQTAPDADEGIVNGAWEQHLVTIGPNGISVK